MVKKELIEKSPLRILEKSIHGGVGAGNIGVIASKKGVGKTACLVHIATDKLFQEKHVIHISFSGKTDHIVSWYEDIFEEIARRLNLDHAMEVHDSIVKYRLIMNFNHYPITVDYVIGRLRTMADIGNFKADCIIIDGYNFYEGSPGDVALIKQFARETGCEVWFSASIMDEPEVSTATTVSSVLERYFDVIDVVVLLTAERGAIHLKLVKDHHVIPDEDLHLRLDSKILLITDEE
jgi:KaiC/GvpD/RAD55 family RecA-like ATPase